MLPGYASQLTAFHVLLLKASEVEEILEGHDERFKSAAAAVDSNAAPTVQNSGPAAAGDQRPLKLSKRDSAAGSSRWSAAAVMPSTFHLDSVPCPTPINRNRIGKANKIRTFPLCFDDADPTAVWENSAHREVLVPIRLDMEFYGTKLRDCFTWNKMEQLITPEQFAEIMCDDLDLSPMTFVPAIAQAIRQQVSARFSFLDLIPK